MLTLFKLMSIIDISSSLSSGEMLETLPLSSPNSQIQPIEDPAENADHQETQVFFFYLYFISSDQFVLSIFNFYVP